MRARLSISSTFKYNCPWCAYCANLLFPPWPLKVTSVFKPRGLQPFKEKPKLSVALSALALGPATSFPTSPLLSSSYDLIPLTTRASSAGLTGTGHAHGLLFQGLCTWGNFGDTPPRISLWFGSLPCLNSLVQIPFASTELLDYHFSYYFTASYFYLLIIFAAWGYWEGELWKHKDWNKKIWETRDQKQLGLITHDPDSTKALVSPDGACV